MTAYWKIYRLYDQFLRLLWPAQWVIQIRRRKGDDNQLFSPFVNSIFFFLYEVFISSLAPYDFFPVSVPAMSILSRMCQAFFIILIFFRKCFLWVWYWCWQMPHLLWHIQNGNIPVCKIAGLHCRIVSPPLT